jgi:hypothetical protein
MQQQDKRVVLATYVHSRVAAMARDAAQASDQTQSGYVRSALIRALRQDGFDLGREASPDAKS